MAAANPELVLPALHSDPLLGRVLRRALTIPAYMLAGAVLLLGAPALVPATAVIDVVRRDLRFPSVRTYLMAAAFVGWEMSGILGCTIVNLRHRSPAARFATLRRLQVWWATGIFRTAVRIFGLRVNIEGQDALSPGPLLVFARHVSIADAFLPIAVISAPTGMNLRYVLRQMFVWEPCLDIIGHSLPHCFVRKGSGRTDREATRVATLYEGLGADEGVVIFLEGGLVTPASRERLLRRLEEKGEIEALAAARSYKHLLPPRPGGPTALLAANPGIDVLFLCHTGFEGATSGKELWRGELIRRRVNVRMVRVPFAQVPESPAAQAAWLNARWLEMDAWVESVTPADREHPG